MDKRDIRIPADLDAVIRTDQPDTISIDGVEIPSRSYLAWRIRSIYRMQAQTAALCVVQSVATIVLAIVILLR